MKKKFLLDTNILMRSPNSIFVFDDNDVLICDTTLEELDDLKTGDILILEIVFSLISLSVTIDSP